MYNLVRVKWESGERKGGDKVYNMSPGLTESAL